MFSLSFAHDYQKQSCCELFTMQIGLKESEEQKLRSGASVKFHKVEFDS